MADGRLFEFSGADVATISGLSALRSRDGMRYDSGSRMGVNGLWRPDGTGKILPI